MPELNWEYPIKDLTPAEYNPRFLSDDAFERLKNSIKNFGMVKPVIINKDGTIVAGHQRTKALQALGIETCPVMILDKKAGTEDEINFNLLHNSVETIDAEATVTPLADVTGGVWKEIDYREINVINRGKARQISLCGRLVTRFGAWGNVVADPETGKVLCNSDYAVVCARQHVNLLVYYAPPDQVQSLDETLRGDFGVYDPDRVVREPWGQYAIQPYRLYKSFSGRPSESVLYNEDIIPTLTKEERVIDFGAGRKAHALKLISEGFKIYPYEPFLTFAKDKGDRKFNIPEIVSDMVKIERTVRRDGLFDIVCLDSVLNASTSDDYHLWITVACSAMMHPDGRLKMATRNLDFEVEGAKSDDAGGGFRQRVQFISPKGRSVSFRLNQWTTIRFHTVDSLLLWLNNWFGEVDLKAGRKKTNLRAECRKPKAIDPELVRTALEQEFNPPYPAGYRHDRHVGVVDAIMEKYMETYDQRLLNGIAVPIESIVKPTEE